MNIEIPPELNLSGLSNAEILARLEAGMDEFARRKACADDRAAVMIPVEPKTLAALERLARIHQRPLTDYLSYLLERTVEQWARHLHDDSRGA
jgi:hypothetical protein